MHVTVTHIGKPVSAELEQMQEKLDTCTQYMLQKITECVWKG